MPQSCPLLLRQGSAEFWAFGFTRTSKPWMVWFLEPTCTGRLCGIRFTLRFLGSDCFTIKPQKYMLSPGLAQQQPSFWYGCFNLLPECYCHGTLGTLRPQELPRAAAGSLQLCPYLDPKSRYLESQWPIVLGYIQSIIGYFVASWPIVLGHLALREKEEWPKTIAHRPRRP